MSCEINSKNELLGPLRAASRVPAADANSPTHSPQCRRENRGRRARSYRRDGSPCHGRKQSAAGGTCLPCIDPHRARSAQCWLFLTVRLSALFFESSFLPGG